MAVNDPIPETESFPIQMAVTDVDLDSDLVDDPSAPYCPCEKEFCECDSRMRVTKFSADSIYSHLGFKAGRKEVLETGVRVNTLHFWGTDHLSTKDLMNWLNEYNPINIEWIDDSSCNIVFNDENTPLRVIVDKTEPFNRRIALAAARVLLNQFSANNEVKDVNSLMPETGCWFKALCVPEGAFALYIRFAGKEDVKQPGAEKRSNYYRLHGKPKDHAPTGSVKSNNSASLASSNSSLARNSNKLRSNKFSKPSANPIVIDLDEQDSSGPSATSNNGRGRQLICYSGLYDNDNEDMFGEPGISTNNNNSRKTNNRNTKPNNNKGSGSRRFNADPIPNLGRPRKFPRKDAFLTLSDRWAGIDNKGYNFNECKGPWSGNLTKTKSGIVVGNIMNSESRSMRADDLSEPLAAITLVPDSTGDHLREKNVFTSKKLLTSLSMVADVEERNNPRISFRSDKAAHVFSKRESVHNRLN